ncbi:ABC transporter ATP-binding protein, partial [Providencia rettgeri]|nr:ABC transporter ATP-binding protein [Providencia rettgeri]
QGLGAEIAFALFGYKRYRMWTLMLSGAFAAIGAMAYSLVVNGFGYSTPQVFLMTLVPHILSGMILGGCLATVLVDALSKTGVLNQYAIMKEKRNKCEQHEFISRVQ